MYPNKQRHLSRHQKQDPLIFQVMVKSNIERSQLKGSLE